MPAEGNKAVVRRYFDEIVSKGNLSLADELFAPSFSYDRSMPGVPLGPARVKWVWCSWRAAFPDWRARIDSLEAGEAVEAGDERVTARISAHGTHRGELVRPGLNRVAPTGKAVTIVATVSFSLENGRIAASTETADFDALFATLGIRRLTVLEVPA